MDHVIPSPMSGYLILLLLDGGMQVDVRSVSESVSQYHLWPIKLVHFNFHLSFIFIPKTGARWLIVLKLRIVKSSEVGGW